MSVVSAVLALMLVLFSLVLGSSGAGTAVLYTVLVMYGVLLMVVLGSSGAGTALARLLYAMSYSHLLDAVDF